MYRSEEETLPFPSGLLRECRTRLGLSQKEMAERAVIYQWESRKRCPSPVFWQRIEALAVSR